MPSEPDTNRESLSKIFKNGEIATIGMGESDSASESGLEDAAEEAITSPLLVLDTSKAGYKYVPVGGKLIPVHVPPPVVPAKSVLITFWSDVDVPRDRVEKAIDLVRKGLPDRVVITSQTSPNQSLEGYGQMHGDGDRSPASRGVERETGPNKWHRPEYRFSVVKNTAWK